VDRFICIHGHFYQPPRENPWLESVEVQDSASPYHDWNARVTSECYAPNAAARILDSDGRIAQITNNYASISFDFGPTLLAWLETERPGLYEAILEADRESARRFSGHGSAMAQAYNHMIMPLANRRDKRTQVIWAIRDFRRRFRRDPEGMWLPETAVDLETLEILAEQGIRFTILSPYQAAQVRRARGRTWRDVGGGRIDPTVPYELRLPSGRRIAVFFYDGPVSAAVAFEKLLARGEDLACRLTDAFSSTRAGSQLAHIATDGETYGHHHRFGEMALAYALRTIESEKLGRLTNYGEFLERNRPVHEVTIHENTAWSCAHGVDRWRCDCGCHAGGRPGWNQRWREPLREALDWLRDALAPRFESRGRRLLGDPWDARDRYIDVILDRSPESERRFWARHAARALTENESIEAIRLLEMQRHAMLMYTSCGWFFDEISGIEAVQVLQYADRAIQLAESVFGEDLRPGFLSILERAPSNIAEFENGRAVYEKCVEPARVDLKKVGAHFGVSSLFEPYGESTTIYCYTVDRNESEILENGRVRLALGRARIRSRITREEEEIAYGVLHLGDHNLSGGVREIDGAAGDGAHGVAGDGGAAGDGGTPDNGGAPGAGLDASARAVEEALRKAFAVADVPQALALLNQHFGAAAYSLRSLFRDEQRKIVDLILAPRLEEAAAAYRHVYEANAPLMSFLAELGTPLPSAFETAASLVVNEALRESLSRDDMNPARVRVLLDEARRRRIRLDGPALGIPFGRVLARQAERLRENPFGEDALERLEELTALASELPFAVNLSETQNIYCTVMTKQFPTAREKAESGDSIAARWVKSFLAIGERIGVRTPREPIFQP